MGTPKPNGKPAVARTIAFQVLRQVADGAYAAELLLGNTADLPSRDAGLAVEITLGVLRRQGQIDFLIEQASNRPLKKIDREVAIALRMGIYQMRFLDRIPAYAAVNDSLNLIRAARKVSSVPFANAVLRKVGGHADMPPEELAVPRWLLEKWTANFGANEALQIAHASLSVPTLYQHVPRNAEPPPGARPTDVPQCWDVAEPDPRYRVQDIGSQSIVPLLKLEPEHRLLDLCAAPGNKTAQALEQTSRVIAADVSWRRLRALRALRLPLAVLDAAEPLPFRGQFDRILVDAPCSGTGTLAHNPEIKWQLSAEDLPRFAERQRRILRNALGWLAPGGLLVYSTCSLEPEENEEVAREIAGPRIEHEIRRTPGRDPGDGFYAAVIR